MHKSPSFLQFQFFDQTILKLEVMVKQLVNKAVSGDLKSIKLVHGLLKYWDHPSRRPVCFRLYPEDP
jgi:hypothetical protein